MSSMFRCLSHIKSWYLWTVKITLKKLSGTHSNHLLFSKKNLYILINPNKVKNLILNTFYREIRAVSKLAKEKCTNLSIINNQHKIAKSGIYIYLVVPIEIVSSFRSCDFLMIPN